ncbi:hypothetical protein [Actinomarinicola tropica]|uniref:Uncharacterized protein n=1 Tax=Actinomarinicola tropica TaxID=2789776 RepID=A0A5Q2RKK3_9ACTN|nr:hypothetical protein [Actinomarinicola tropica]QGG96014.1 hypothetical protein GH723_13410 [Actinomarinicola tropica]
MLVPAVLSPSAHGFWRDLIWYVVWVVAPAWLVVAFLAALVSVGAWGPRVNVVLAGVVVLAPVLVCLALGGDWILVGPMVGAAALATGFTAARRWRSSPARVPASR